MYCGKQRSGLVIDANEVVALKVSRRLKQAIEIRADKERRSVSGMLNILLEKEFAKEFAVAVKTRKEQGW